MLSRGKMGGMPDSSQAIRSKDDHAGCLRHLARKNRFYVVGENWIMLEPIENVKV